ncbi:hypothetical protein [Candidatus Mesenet endosymbiont of Phosphuga atrata]|uniref:hypothetical protein n=1 Tax=Candidatus Mesenet endosymbiont of Phosphuga atrata TaxID=3066221 RepID=UPI0030CBA1F7
MHDTAEVKNLDELSSNVCKIFNIEKVEYIRPQDKITGVKFSLNQSSKDLNIIAELLNLYIVPAFVLPSDRKNKDVSVRIGNRQETFIVKRYIKQNDAYIESTQLEQQKSSGGWLEKAKNTVKSSINVVHNLINGKEEIEFIEINKDNLNFQISSNESTEVEITFAESEINMQHMEGILNCISNFKGLTNNDAIKPQIKINCDHPVAESQDKLNIHPFFAQRTIKNNKGNIKQQETTLCLTTTQNDVELVSSIFRDNTSQLKIKYKENEYSLLSYNLDNPFSQNLVDFLLFFNDSSCNGNAKISNLQKVEKIFSEDIEIKNGQEDSRIKIENATCFTSSLYYKDRNLQLKKSSLGEKIYFNFEVRVENDLDQIEKKSGHIYRAVIYKIISLISFFDLLLNEDKFSILIEIDGKKNYSIERSLINKTVAKFNNLFNVKYYTEYLNDNISTQLNALAKSLNMQVLDLFCTKKVSLKLETEVQKIAINRLENIKHLVNGISALESCKKEFLDNTSNPSMHCYLSNFFYEGNNLSCVYVITHPKNLSINGGLLDKNSAIDFLQNELQKNFDRISNNLKQIQKEENFSVYSIDINIDKLLSQHIDKFQEEEAIEAKEETKIIEVKAESEKYDVDWQEECFVKITPANDYTSLELSLKEACEFVHRRVQHVCKQLLEKINALQCGKEQKAEQDDQLSIDESIIQATLDDNISNFNKFADEKVRKFKDIKPDLDVEQRKVIDSIGNSTLNAVQRYGEVAKIYLFINKNANDLQGILKKNVEELERLMLGISTSKEESEEVENEVTLKHVLELFDKLSKKLSEWEGQDQDFQNKIASSIQKKSIPDLFCNLTSKITHLIKQKDANVEQTQTLDQYKQILNLAYNIFYSAKILHYYKIQNGFEKLEIEIHNITHDCLKKELDEKEEELKRREVQLEQMTSVKEDGSDIIISTAQSVISLCKEVKNKVINFKNQFQPQNSNVQNIEYLNDSFCNQGNGSTHNHSSQQSGYKENNIKVTSQLNYSTADSAYNHKSNLQKLKAGIKDAFSEKENYAFFVFIAVGTAGTLAYFVPEGLRKFVPSKKLNIIDITVAVGVTALIALSVVALAYSVYTNIVHSNMTDPTAFSHNQNLTHKS